MSWEISNFAPMDRTFHHRITVGAVCGIVLLLILAVYAFWVKSVILGLFLVLALVLVSEKSLHTRYIFHDKELIIYNGRLSKSKHIPLAAIHSCKPLTTVFGLVHYLLLGYGDSKMVSVQPDNELAFVDVLRNRIQEGKEADNA